MCTSSRRRARQGRQPLYGTAWMVPPSYNQSQHEYNNQAYGGPAPAPPYGAGPGANHQDGYYDTNGNWVATTANAGSGAVGAGAGNPMPPASTGNSGLYTGAPQQQHQQQGQHQHFNAAPPPGPPPTYAGGQSSSGSTQNEYEMSNMPFPAAYKK